MNPPTINISTHPSSRDRFLLLATTYLLLPLLIFVLTWVRPWMGIPLALAGFFGLYRMWSETVKIKRFSPNRWTWVLILGLALLWTYLGGAGGYVPQQCDYHKHNLLFHDLLTRPWPVRYPGATGEQYLCYGLGYYLPPVFCARILGFELLSILVLMWSYAGVVLVFYWLATLKSTPKRTLLIVLLFSSTEAAWQIFIYALRLPVCDEWGKSVLSAIHGLGLGSGYGNFFIAFQYRPQHVIPAWLGAALLYEIFWVRGSARGAVLVFTACLFWSPLMTPGLCVVPLAAAGRWNRRDVLGATNMIGAILAIPLMFYFMGHVPIAENAPIWKFSDRWFLIYLLFVVMQMAPFGILWLAEMKYHFLGRERRLFLWSLALLLLLPFYRFGLFGDLRIQAAVPALLFVGLSASACLQSDQFSIRRPIFALLIVSQLAGAAYPIAKWSRLEIPWSPSEYSYERTSRDFGITSLAGLRTYYYDFAPQYMGRTNSPADRWLLRRSVKLARSQNDQH